MMTSSLANFITKYKIDTEGEEELILLLNESLKNINLESTELKEIKTEIKTETKGKRNQRYKSRKAEEFAKEHGLNMEDFEELEISKKDVERKIKERTQESLQETKIIKPVDTIKNLKKERVICSGLNKRGEACKVVGTVKPEGEKRMYCYRHAEDFALYEIEDEDD